MLLHQIDVGHVGFLGRGLHPGQHFIGRALVRCDLDGVMQQLAQMRGELIRQPEIQIHPSEPLAALQLSQFMKDGRIFRTQRNGLRPYLACPGRVALQQRLRTQHLMWPRIGRIALGQLQQGQSCLPRVINPKLEFGQSIGNFHRRHRTHGVGLDPGDRRLGKLPVAVPAAAHIMIQLLVQLRVVHPQQFLADFLHLLRVDVLG